MYPGAIPGHPGRSGMARDGPGIHPGPSRTLRDHLVTENLHLLRGIRDGFGMTFSWFWDDLFLCWDDISLVLG